MFPIPKPVAICELNNLKDKPDIDHQQYWRDTMDQNVAKRAMPKTGIVWHYISEPVQECAQTPARV